MRVVALKTEWEWFKQMSAEARTRTIEVSTYRRFEDDREITLELKEVRS